MIKRLRPNILKKLPDRGDFLGTKSVDHHLGVGVFFFFWPVRTKGANVNSILTVKVAKLGNTFEVIYSNTC